MVDEPQSPQSNTLPDTLTTGDRPQESPALQATPPLSQPAIAPPESHTEISPHDSGVHLQSKKRLFYVGFAVALLNPVISGLLIGILFTREAEMRREGKIIIAVAVAWGIAVLFISRKLGLL